tara:strand:+ start:1919 stop:2431 length:513 start_codon:yes stop_codon:yes gene_type:complete
MRKLLGIVILGLLWCSNSFADVENNILILECTHQDEKKIFYNLNLETSFIISQNGDENQFYYDDNDIYILGATSSIDGISKVNRRLINRYTGEGIMDHYRLNDQESDLWHKKMSEKMIKETTLISGSEHYNKDVANRKNYMWYYWYKSLDQFKIVKSVKFNCDKIKEKKF